MSPVDELIEGLAGLLERIIINYERNMNDGSIAYIYFEVREKK